MRNFIVLAAFASGIMLTGCGNACDAANAQSTARYEECGVDLGDGGDGGEATACTEESGALLQCYADCADATTCDVLNACADLEGDDLTACGEDAADYGDCVVDCAA